MGPVWRRLGTKGTVIEFLDHIVPGTDNDVSETFLRLLKKQGMKFKLKTKVESAEVLPSGGAKLQIDSRDGGKPESLEADIVLVPTGNRLVHKRGILAGPRQWTNMVQRLREIRYAITADSTPGWLQANRPTSGSWMTNRAARVATQCRERQSGRGRGARTAGRRTRPVTLLPRILRHRELRVVTRHRAFSQIELAQHHGTCCGEPFNHRGRGLCHVAFAHSTPGKRWETLDVTQIFNRNRYAM